MVHESVELCPQSPSEDAVGDDGARLDVPLVGGLREVGRGDEGPVVVDDDALGVEAGARLALGRQRPGVVEGLGESLARPQVVLEGVRELPQENGVGGVVPLFPMDVDEEPHPQIRLSIHPACQGPEQLLGLALPVSSA